MVVKDKKDYVAEGYQAAKNGKTFNDNPYEAKDLQSIVKKIDWEKGCKEWISVVQCMKKFGVEA